MGKIGDVEITILSEDINRSNDVTDRKVEDGSISDNIKNNPDVINITGVAGKNGWESLKKLLEYKKEGKLLRFESRNIYGNVVIETLNTNHPYTARDGYRFTCTLKQITITKSKLVQINVPTKIKTQVKANTNAGTKATKSKTTDTQEKQKVISKYGTAYEKV